MSAHEFTFGKTECEVHIDDRNYLARLFVWEESGHALREVGTRDGKAKEIMRADKDATLNAAIQYLSERFGPKGSPPQRKTGTYSVRVIKQPPLRDKRQAQET